MTLAVTRLIQAAMGPVPMAAFCRVSRGGVFEHQANNVIQGRAITIGVDAYAALRLAIGVAK